MQVFCTIPDSSCAGTENISDRAFAHTQNDFDTFLSSVNKESNQNGSQQRGAKIGFHVAERWFKFWAISVHTRPKYFSQRNK